MKARNKTLASVMAGIVLAGTAQAAVIGEWNFDDQSLINSGTSGTNHNGVTSGTAIYTTDTPTGSGYALDLSGSAGFMTVLNSSTNDAGYLDTFDNLTDFSLSMWVKSPSGSWGSWEELAGKGSESGLSGWAIRGKNFADTVNGGLRATFYGGGGQAWDQYPFAANLAGDQLWHLITMTYDNTASNLTLYIDGDWMDTGSNAAHFAAVTNALVFDTREGDTSRSADFMYDNIQFYDTALSSNEVSSMYQEQTEFDISTDQIFFNLLAPATTASGGLTVSFASSMTNAEVAVNVSISDETHAGAFTPLTTTPLVLTNQSESAGLEFEFDNSVANLTEGQSATGQIIIAWNVVGDSTINEVMVPYSIQLTVPETYDVIVLDNDFGEEGDIGPDFIEKQAGTTGGYTDPASGIFSTGRKNNSLYGLDSEPELDITSINGAVGFIVEWTVSTSTDNPAYNGLQFRVSDTNETTWLGIGLVTGNYGDMKFIESGTGSSLGVTTPSTESLADGYTISLTVNSDDTWSASSIGLSADFSTGGSLVAGTFENISTNLRVSAFYQGYSQSCTLDHVTVGVIQDASQPVLGLAGTTVSWPTSSTRVYEIECTDRLVGGTWTPCGSVTGAPPQAVYELPIDGTGAKFFRVVAP